MAYRSASRRLRRNVFVPTVQESGVKDLEAATWHGIYAPKGTQKPVIDKLAAAYAKVMADKEFTSKLQEQAIQLLPEDQYGPAAFGKHTAAEVERWRAVITKANTKLD